MVLQQRRSIQAPVSRKGSGSGWGNSVYGAVLLLVGVALVAVVLYMQVLSSLAQWQQKPRHDTAQSSNAVRSKSVAESGSELGSVEMAAKVQSNEQPLHQQKKPVADHETVSKSVPASSSQSKETLLMKTPSGSIKIVLRSDLSPESADYVRRLVDHVSQPGQECRNCRLYRAEKPGILQGVLRHPDVPPSTALGACPPGYEGVKNDCPKWDANCQCHGPVMTKGMVGWAAGKSGPDFFIDNYPSPAKWWGTQHTVWGEIQDAESFALIDSIWDLPVKNEGGLTMLKQPIHFTLEMVATER